MVPAGNKAKRLSSVSNHTTKTIQFNSQNISISFIKGETQSLATRVSFKV